MYKNKAKFEKVSRQKYVSWYFPILRDGFVFITEA